MPKRWESIDNAGKPETGSSDRRQPVSPTSQSALLQFLRPMDHFAIGPVAISKGLSGREGVVGGRPRSRFTLSGGEAWWYSGGSVILGKTNA